MTHTQSNTQSLLFSLTTQTTHPPNQVATWSETAGAPAWTAATAAARAAARAAADSMDNAGGGGDKGKGKGKGKGANVQVGDVIGLNAGDLAAAAVVFPSTSPTIPGNAKF